jgi:hypothetical protein
MTTYNGGRCLGEVYKPEDFLRRRQRKPSDLTPTPTRKPCTPHSFEGILNEINSLKLEITKIKEALKIHGITIE